MNLPVSGRGWNSEMLVTAIVETLVRDDVLRESPFEALAAREKKIVPLLAAGCSNREISTQLHLSEKTVKNYVSAILTKLGLHSRTQVAVIALGGQSDRWGSFPHE
jgi:two-component system, NarL family, response regulator DevR